jgi:hypothetical protein
MKKEYTLIFIVGLFILAYVLDAVVDPLTIQLATPYSYFNPKNFSMYPFTTASIVIKTIGVFLTPMWLFSFFDGKAMAKGSLLLVFSGLIQLYAVQEVATGSQLIPLEYSLSLTLSGILLLIPAVIYLITGMFTSAHQSLSGEEDNDIFEDQEDDEENETEDEEESAEDEE